jgi:hypothetical protein
MTSLRRAWVPLLAAVVTLAPATANAAGAPTQPDQTQAVVDLTFDLTVGFIGAEEVALDSSMGRDGYQPVRFTRPTDAPLPSSSPLTQAGLKLTPGSTVVASVFSDHRVNDSLCITGTSTRTPTVVYLSTKTMRPSLKRPHGCAKPMLTPPSQALVAKALATALDLDLKITSIGEQSYATDNEGAYVADTLSRPTKAALPRGDVLVQQGVTLNVGDKVVVTLFTQTVKDDSYCITGTVLKTHKVRYLSSYDDIPTSHRPHGCVAA